jgi:thiosulfate/3-mercaptopyruvate sulfurtransferase
MGTERTVRTAPIKLIREAHVAKFLEVWLILGGILAASAVAVAQERSARDRLLIDAAGLAAILDSPDLVLLHVGDRAEYEARHIPGAQYIELAQISAPRSNDPGALSLELPAAGTLRETLQSLGISDESRIIVYYGNDWVTPATRVILTLTWAGLGDRVSLLDGGMQAWQAAGHAVTAEVAAPHAGRLSPLRTESVVVTAAQVQERLGDAGFAIIDARAPRFYEGAYEERNGERPGHIAGAHSVPFTEVVDEALRMKDTAALRALFREAGVEATDTVIAYCHIGQQATVVVFAARLIGQPVLLYDGSYTEWGRNPAFPIEKASGAGGVEVAGPSRLSRRVPPPRLGSPLLSGRRALSGDPR